MMKFIASDVEAAKAKARRAFGEAAVILSVRDLPSGDVEVAASNKPEAGAPDPARAPAYGDEARRVIDDPHVGGQGGRGGGARLNEPLERKFSESNLSRLSASVTHGRGRGAAEPRIDPSTEGLVEALRPHGVDDELLAALLDGARRARIDDDYYKLETAFSEVFDFAPLKAAAGAPVMLVGPTGAGKTSCSAKLSAAAMTRGGGAFMMTADVGRAGAVEQVRTYGESLGADYYIVETPLDVAQALRSKRPRGFVLLDTPGISPFDAGDLAALKSFQEASAAEPVLVLPASGDTNEWRDWAQAFAEFGVRRMIITKFDATKRVGAGLSAAHAGRMALANFSESPFISEGLLPASAEFLAKRLLAARPGRIGG